VFEGYFGSPSTQMFLLVERWLARRTDVLIAISAQVRKDLLQTYAVAREEQVKVIPLGFDLDRLIAISTAERRAARAALQVPDGAIAVTTVGRLTAIKQHALFLEMASRLARGAQSFLFVIAGDGELRKGLEDKAGELGIADRTRFLGWRGDLQTIYGATDVFVLTSRNEGTPVALIEAMAAGVASVSTDVGGVRDVITGPDVGVLVPFGGADALADAVMSLAHDPARREELGRAARASVRERFHGRRLLQDVKILYCGLLGISGTIADQRT
jgi:glycosyltransferase involved in cell wall biosynthesis